MKILHVPYRGKRDRRAHPGSEMGEHLLLAGTEAPIEAARVSRAGKTQRSWTVEDELCPHTE